MEQNSLFLANCANFGNWLDCSNLVIGCHNRDQNCLVGKSVAQLLKIYPAQGINRKPCDFPAIAFKTHARVDHRFVLGDASDDVIALFTIHRRNTFYGKVVALGGT